MKKMKILNEILYGKINLIDHFDRNQDALLEEEVVVKPKYVKWILEQYLNEKINENELQKWADFICIRCEYVVPGGDDDRINDYYEPMYYVIQRLSTPQLDGDITPNLVRKYMEELDVLKEPEDLDLDKDC